MNVNVSEQKGTVNREVTTGKEELGKALDSHGLTFMGHGVGSIDMLYSILSQGKLRVSNRGSVFGTLSYEYRSHGPFDKNAGIFVFDHTKGKDVTYVPTSEVDPVNPNYNIVEIFLEDIDYILFPDELAEAIKLRFPQYNNKIKTYNELMRLVQAGRADDSVRGSGLNFTVFPFLNVKVFDQLSEKLIYSHWPRARTEGIGPLIWEWVKGNGNNKSKFPWWILIGGVGVGLLDVACDNDQFSTIFICQPEGSGNGQRSSEVDIPQGVGSLEAGNRLDPGIVILDKLDIDFINSLKSPGTLACVPGEVQIFPSSRGYVVCNWNKVWEGECFPKDVKFNSETGLPLVCNNDFKFVPLSGTTINTMSLKAFKEAQLAKDNFEYLYKIKLIADSGYWKTNDLVYLGRLFDKLPPDFYQGKLLRLSTIVKGSSSGGRALDRDIPQTVIISGANTNTFVDQFTLSSGDFRTYLSTIVHELTHLKDKDQLISSSKEFLDIKDKYGIWAAPDNLFYRDDPGTDTKIVLEGYDCSHYKDNYIFEELLACLSGAYVFQPNKLCAQMPDFCVFFKDNKDLYNGNTYQGKDVLNEVKQGF